MNERVGDSPDPDNQALKSLEKVVGTSLPDGLFEFYRTRLFEVVPLPSDFHVPDHSSPWIESVSELYGPEEAIDFLECDLRSMECGTRVFPPHTIPLGGDGNGEYFVVSTRKSDFGAVLFPFHEVCDPMDETLSGIIRLAPDVPTWIAGFQEPSGRHFPEKSGEMKAPVSEFQPARAKKKQRPWWNIWRS